MSTPRNQLRDNDTRFISFAQTLTHTDWQQPSLCTEWSNQEVLAHLVVGYAASPYALAAQIIAHRGSFNRANATLARDLAEHRGPAGLLDEFGALMLRPRGIGRVFPQRLLLGDHVIHELDIALALGKVSAIEAVTLTSVLNTQVRVPNPFVPAAARARGLTLRALDAEWTYHGGERTVVGAAAHLASVLAGRPWALDHLDGDGVDALRARM